MLRWYIFTGLEKKNLIVWYVESAFINERFIDEISPARVQYFNLINFMWIKNPL